MHSAGDAGRNRTDRQRIKRKAGYRKMLPGERQAMLAARPGDGDGRGVRGGQDRGAAGKISGEADDVIRVLSTLVSILIAVLLEKTTRANSGLAPSQTDKDERRQRQGPEAEPADG